MIKNVKHIQAAISLAFDGADLKRIVDNYGIDKFFADVIEYAEQNYLSGHSMRFTILRDVTIAYYDIKID